MIACPHDHSNKPRSWLPETALTGATPGAFSDMLAGWSSKWMAAGALSTSGAFRRDSPAQLGGGRWMSNSSNLWIWIGPEADLLLAALMLDAGRDAKAASDGDRQIVEAIASRAIDDLCSRVSGLFKAGNSPWQCGEAPVTSDILSVNLTSGSDTVLLFAATAEQLVRLIRHNSPPIPAEPVVPLLDSLTDQEVEIGAWLGQSRARLEEIATIEAGDVLLLDRSPEASVDVAVDGVRTPLRCHVEEEAGALRLRLVA